MPVQSWAHGQYWGATPSTSAPPPNDPIYVNLGYPSWQGGVVVASGFGGIGAWLSALYTRVRWWWQFIARFTALPAQHQGLIVHVLGLLETSPSQADVAASAAFVAHVHALPPVEQVLIRRMAQVFHDPKWPLAQAAVQRTAHTLGFNRPESWLMLSRMLKHDRKAQENNFRHLEACRLLRANVIGSTLSNPECHLLVELAYHRYTVEP
jgi:hypothetical protein